MRATDDRSTYRSLHFLNAGRLQDSVFPCAVDSFLETSFVVLRSLIGNLERKSEFFDKLFTCFERYSALIDNSITGPINVDIEALLTEIRQPVWDFLALTCPSFTNRNLDAQFAEIFSDNVFQHLTLQEKELFCTYYVLKGRCKDCGTYLSAAEYNVLNYITVSDLNNLENLDDWKALLNPLREKRLHYTCGTSAMKIYGQNHFIIL